MSKRKSETQEARAKRLARMLEYRKKNSAAISVAVREWRLSSVVNVLRARLASAKDRATKRKLPFDLTLEYLLELYYSAPHCALTKLPFDIMQKRDTVSLDRIDSRGGYTIGNVRFVLGQVNLAINEWGTSAFDGMCLARVAALKEN